MEHSKLESDGPVVILIYSEMLEILNITGRKMLVNLLLL
jgi:hypothetical protein